MAFQYMDSKMRSASLVQQDLYVEPTIEALEDQSGRQLRLNFETVNQRA